MSIFPSKKMLFVGLAHPARDTRLCFFLAKAIRDRFPNIECVYLGHDSVDPDRYSNEYFTVLRFPHGMNPLKRRFRAHDMEILAEYIRDSGIDLVQISDSRELLLGYVLKKKTSIPVIFDVHEDYFNQKYEYLHKSLKGFIKGVVARGQELLLTRFMDSVFCTDEFLKSMYTSPVFATKSVDMVRNIPPRDFIRETPILNQRDELELIYAGTPNYLRGIIETADYCERFNSEPVAERQGISLTFHLFSRQHEVVDKVKSCNNVIYHGFVPRPEIEKRIKQFDIGVSLLLPCKKFERNIPMKNFEYMAEGIPILTSNFGPLLKYVSEARAGLTINPLSYDEFKEAILKFKDRDFRQACGENGLAYAKKQFRRDREVSPYLNTVARLLGMITD